MSSPISTARTRLWIAATGSVVLLTLGWQGVSTAAPQLEPTATCPAPDLNACRVVLNIGQLSAREEAALQAGAGSRLAIEYRRDWARPSRVPLILWVVFGGAGLVWTFHRYARR